MLEVRNIDAHYGEFCALSDVSIEMSAGKTIIVVGANGAGKSTLLRTISGLLHPKPGEIYFEGERIDKKRPHEIVEKGIQMVPEGGRLFAKLTVYDNLKAGGYNKKARASFKENLEEIFSLFPVLKDRQRQAAGSLSGGERQMVAIARSLMGSPKLIMLDEPSLGLAPKVVSRVFDLIQHMKDKGYSVLVVEQNAKKALDLADYGYLLESGKLIFEGKREQFDENAFIKKAYLGL